MNKIIKLTRLDYKGNEVIGGTSVLLNIDSLIIVEPNIDVTYVKYREDVVKVLVCKESVDTIMQLINQKMY